MMMKCEAYSVLILVMKKWWKKNEIIDSIDIIDIESIDINIINEWWHVPSQIKWSSQSHINENQPMSNMKYWNDIESKYYY